MPPHPFGFWSLLPPLVAIACAVATRRVVASLVAGVFVGSLIITGGNPVTALVDTCEARLWNSLVQEDLLRVFVFTCLMGAMVGVIQQSGAMRAVVDLFARSAHNRRRGQLTTWALGLAIFFDDYANTLLLGKTMAPLADRLRISREKLAYLVDSTAAPVAGLALISTWIAGEIGYINAGLIDLFPDEAARPGFQIFVQSIPYRFYVLYALAFVFLVGWMRRDFGPMLRAEQRAMAGEPTGIHSPSIAEESSDEPYQPHGAWYHAAGPISVLVAVTMWLLVLTGQRAVGTWDAAWWTIIGNGDSYIALVYGSLAGFFAAALWIGMARLLSWQEIRRAAAQGAATMAPALAILWAARGLTDLTGDISPEETSPLHLGTAQYLAQILQGNVSLALMPTLVFVLASLVAFCTGTSWGTMGILTPLTIKITLAMLPDSAGMEAAWEHPLFLAAVGSVLAGAIFGDHCSPLSDTTVLSSQACGCDHIAHVTTQFPYALSVATVSIFIGTLPVAYGAPVWAVLPLGLVALAMLLRIFGKQVE